MNPDFRDLLSEFSDANVEFIVVGAHALAAHGHVRATKDLDIWVRPAPENAARVLRALGKFGAPLAGLAPEDFSAPGMTFQIGVAPVRIDVLTEIDGVAFDVAWASKEIRVLEGLEVPVLSAKDLLQNKRASGRLQDLADVEALERLLNQGR